MHARLDVKQVGVTRAVANHAEVAAHGHRAALRQHAFTSYISYYFTLSLSFFLLFAAGESESKMTTNRD